MIGASVFIFCYSHQGKMPLLLSRMKEVAKVFLATNSDYKYTDVSIGLWLRGVQLQIAAVGQAVCN